MFESLVDFFIEDYMAKKYVAEKSGWRTLGEIADKSHVSPSALYGKHSTLGQALDEPVRRGLIETRIFPGERGRGGEVMRLRVAYDKEPIRDFVNKKVMLGRNATIAPTEQQITTTQTLFSPASIEASQEVEESGQRKIAVIMFTDIVGYTALAQTDESHALGVLERHNRLLRPFFTKYHGREVKTIGDSFLVEFDSALDATNCGIEIQKFLHDYNISTKEDWKIKLRIGIHLGDVVLRGKDILGDAVNIASRIQPLADPEGVCVSQQVLDQVHNKIAYSMEQLEHPELKNVKFSPNVYTVLMPWEKRTVGSRLVEQASAEEVNRLSIAVLPFSSMSPDPNDEYFADGMTEELISTISRISGLQVIARTSVMGYKGSEKKIDEIAKELKVGTILEGSVRKSGEKLRITAQLIDSEKSGHLWSESYDRELKDVFAIQSEVAQRVAQTLSVVILAEEKHRVSEAPTKNVEAYELYLRGLTSVPWRKGFIKENTEKSIAYFQRAIQLDPNFALAYAALANCYSSELIGALDMDKAEAAARKALSIDDNLPEAHAAMSWVLHNKYDWNGEDQELERAIKLNPNLVEALQWKAYRLVIKGKFDEALAERKLAEELDPLSPGLVYGTSTILSLSRKYEEALAHLVSKARETNTYSYHNLVGAIHFIKSEYGSALKEYEKALESAQADEIPYAKANLACVFAKTRRNDQAYEILAELEEIAKQSHLLPDFSFAPIYFCLGDYDRCFEWLEKAADEYSPTLYSVKIDHFWDDLRYDLRYIALMKKIGLMSLEEAMQEERRIDSRKQRAQLMFDRKRIAVLPFSSMSPNPNDEYFADGMTEELISTISKISGIQVIARTSVLHYKGGSKSIDEISKELKVGTILEGSVRKAGDKLRITAQLIDTKDSRHLWSETYNKDLKDVFAIQSEIAETVADSLEVRLLSRETERIRKKPTTNSAAYLLYLKGVHHQFSDRTESGQKKAIEYFQKCVQVDPNFAAAYAGMSDCFDTLSELGTSLIDRRDLLSKAENLASRAMNIDPNRAESHFAMCNVKIRKMDLHGAEVEVKKALEFNPNLASAHQNYAYLLLLKTRLDLALGEVRKALDLDPLSATTNFTYVVALYFARQYDRAEEHARKILELDLGIEKTSVHGILGRIYCAASRFEEALAEFVISFDPSKVKGVPVVLARLGFVYAKLGRRDIAIRILNELMVKGNDQDTRLVPLHYSMFCIYIALGEIDNGLQQLEKADVEELQFSPILLANDPILDEVRSDPRFIAVLKKIGLRQ